MLTKGQGKQAPFICCTNKMQDVRHSHHKPSQGMKPGSSFGNLILSGSHWNGTTLTSVRKKRLAACH
jgi:hypothetical protein